jgi:hypothetical protein
MRKTPQKIKVCRIFICERFPLIYINFNFDFLNLHNIFFENYFANELTRSIVLKQFKTFAVRVLSDLKILGFASYPYIW